MNLNLGQLYNYNKEYGIHTDTNNGFLEDREGSVGNFLTFLYLWYLKFHTASSFYSLLWLALLKSCWPDLKAGFYPLEPIEFFSFCPRLVFSGLAVSSSWEPDGLDLSHSLKEGWLSYFSPMHVHSPSSLSLRSLIFQRPSNHIAKAAHSQQEERNMPWESALFWPNSWRSQPDSPLEGHRWFPCFQGFRMLVKMELSHLHTQCCWLKLVFWKCW